MTDRDHALALVPVSCETVDRLDIYVDLLKRWQTIKNLVAPSTLTYIWTRHIADSAQLLALAPSATEWVDLGSGAGFPGLVIALQLAETPGAHVTLIESNQRKCAFMRTVIRETDASATVVAGRLEIEISKLRHERIHAVTARALAPLGDILRAADLLLMSGAIGLFPKGRDVERELTDDPLLRRFDIDILPSRTDPNGKVLRVEARVRP